MLTTQSSHSFCGMPGYHLAEDKAFLRVNTADKTKGLDQMWVWSRYKSPPHPRFFAGLGYCLKNCTTLDFDSRAPHWRAWDPADWAISTVLGQGGCNKRYLGTCNHFLCLSSGPLAASKNGHQVAGESLIHFTTFSWIKHSSTLVFLSVPYLRLSVSCKEQLAFRSHLQDQLSPYLKHMEEEVAYDHATSGFIES